MKPKTSKILTGLTALGLGLSLSLGATSAEANKRSFVTIGTGGVTGVYYPTGGAICNLVNRNTKSHGIRCSAESTGGSEYNVNTIRAGELDFGIAQSDVQFNSYAGKAQFADKGAFKELRAVFSLHPEALTIVARANANATNLEDLKGKRVNVGNPGSGQRGAMELILSEMGTNFSYFSQAADLRPAEMSAALCDNRIDAMTYFVGHPNGSIKEATSSCPSNLVNIQGATVDKIISKYPYFRKATIPGGEYANNPNDTHTFGVAATLVSSTNTSDEQVYQLVKAVFENLDAFKRRHPAFANLKAEEMVKDGLAIPLHPGAEKYYREAGLIQ